jgi:chorismate dehydratase
MNRLRISAISFLNTVPLMWDFEHGTAGADFEISYTLPSACAAALQAGRADIGIIPAAAYAQIPDLAVIPGVAIAARRPVRSILLVSKAPVEKIQSVALDTSSMTSVALTKILFARWLGGNRKYVPMAPDLDAMLRDHDAALVIGDTALKVDRCKYLTVDLAEEWIHFTGKPFVFAFWAIRQAALEGTSIDLAAVFQASRDHGLLPESLSQISQVWGPKLGIRESDVRSYLIENIHYQLDSGCIEGLELFYRYAAECDAIPAQLPLHFVEAPRFATT